MTQNEKDLLLKDLCARLPYGVKAEKYTIRLDGEFVPLANIETVTAKDIIDRDECPGYTIKPYLFPLSSMTWEQECQYREVIASSLNHYEVYDWLNKNHFDYRNLINKNLAIDCTNLNIY